jgi:membrane protein implicated in regulation of membrane protease activity
MMIACWIPMIVVAALVAAGATSAVWVLFAVACVVVMWLMMRGMNHGDHDRTPPNQEARR